MSEVGPGKPPVEHQFQPGVSGNPNGRPKGRRSLSTIVRDVLEEKIDWELLPVEKPEQLSQKYGTKVGWEALVIAAYARALEGDVRAAEWLRKSGYGDKIDITTNEKDFIPVQIFDLRGNASNATDDENKLEAGDTPSGDNPAQ